MKLYLFNNGKCMGIQSGIQGAHAAVRLMHKYYDDSKRNSKFVDMINDWATNHETVAVVDGGSHFELVSMEANLVDNDYVPFATFVEPDLNYAYTSIAILCTQDMVSDMTAYRKKWISDDEMYDRYHEFATVLINIATAPSAK